MARPEIWAGNEARGGSIPRSGAATDEQRSIRPKDRPLPIGFHHFFTLLHASFPLPTPPRVLARGLLAKTQKDRFLFPSHRMATLFLEPLWSAQVARDPTDF